ncbi:MAG: hypothetical protein GY951_02070 [Psychromonas sp.]|nr:hypothetical protein [Psychromonas sp.]
MIEDATYHDNTIHSVEFIDEEYETKLVLDIDYISEWEECGDRCKFKISPASLIFEGVGDLDIKITKPGFTQQSYMDVILDIKTTELNGNRKKYVIQLLNESYIQFEATGSLLKVRGKALLKNEQHLTTSERENA